MSLLLGDTAVELLDNKTDYLQMMSGSEYYDDLIEKYDMLEKTYDAWQLDLRNVVNARLDYQQSLETKKIDPFIAGGATSQMLGFGAGIYTAFENEVRNEKIDAQRNQHRQKTLAASAKTKKEEINLEMLVYPIVQMLDSNYLIKEKRNEYYYNLAKLHADYGDQEKKKYAAEIYASLGDYKDSRTLSERVQKEGMASFYVTLGTFFLVFIGFFFLYCDENVLSLVCMGIGVLVAVPNCIVTFVVSARKKKALEKNYYTLGTRALEILYGECVKKAIVLNRQRMSVAS